MNAILAEDQDWIRVANILVDERSSYKEAPVHIFLSCLHFGKTLSPCWAAIWS